MASDIDLEAVSRGTPGFSGADLANLVNEAAIVAIRSGRESITTDDFFVARDRIILGRRDATNALLPNEKRSVAVHESGHALVAVLSPHADPVSKVTILPAGHALGVTQMLPVDPAYLGDQLISSRQYSEATQQLIDEEVQRLLKEAGARATQLLSDHREALDRLIDLLLEKETIDGDEVLAVAAGPADSQPQGVATLSHSASRPAPGQPPTA
jgi:ATP-dependent Zn protease